MKKQTQKDSRGKQWSWQISILVVIAILIIFSTLIVSASSSLFAPPPPTPFSGNGPKNDATPTPDQTQVAFNLTVNPNVFPPTSTKIIIAKRTNLSPDLNPLDTYTFIISHQDGTNEEVTFGPVPEGDVTMNVPANVMSKLILQPGDKIISKTNNRGLYIGGPTLVPTSVVANPPTVAVTVSPTTIPPAYP